MKKFYFLVLCFTASIVVYGATIPRAILSHDGVLTQYDAAHWQDAITNAVDGDIVYFTPGDFHGAITITKAITLIGAGISATDAFYASSETLSNVYNGCATTGVSTKIFGNITIAIPGGVTLTKPLMVGICVTCIPGYARSSLFVTEAVTGLTIKRCQFEGTGYSMGGGEFNPQATVTNMTLENCYIYNLQCANLVNPTIRNCYIDELHNVPEGLSFTNSVVLGIGQSTKNCTFINCIVHGGYESNHNIFNYCLHRDNDATSTYNGGATVYDPQAITKSQMITNNYYGNDNTVIGPLGGPAPFTFKPSQPYVASSALNYNATTKKLNVTMTINKGE